MIEDELVKIWQSSPNQERVKFEKSRLMIDVQSNLDSFHKKIKFRDLGELIGALIGMPFFAFYAFIIPYPVTKIASVLIIAWGVFVIIRLRNARKHKPSAFTETYMEYMYKSREYLKIQKQLLDSVLYWYILPCLSLLFMFVLGMGSMAGRMAQILKSGVLFTGMGIAIYYLNKRAVKKQFVPRLEKIDELIKVMEAA